MTGGAVVVLGKTGRNFAAGMSGGVAYVFDREHAFRDRCNLAMVELEPLGDSEAWLVRGMIEDHVRHTGSALGARILDTWEQVADYFVAVVPTDYKRVLAQRRAARSGSVAIVDAPGSSGSGPETTAETTAGDGAASPPGASLSVMKGGAS